MRVACVRFVIAMTWCAWSSVVSANEVQRDAPVVAPVPVVTPTSPTTAATPVEVAQPPATEAPPADSPPADSPPSGLVIQEIPTPPPSYTTAPQTVPTVPVPQTATTPPAPQPSTPMLAPTWPNASPPPTTPPGAHTHNGFFFRGSLGIATAIAVEQHAGSELHVGGLGAPITLAVGGTLKDANLALYGEFHGLAITEPNVRVDDERLDNVERVFVASLGFGASYYLMPLNLYFAGTLGIGALDLYRSESSTEPDGSTGTGLSLRVAVGKEWWAGNEWGLGVAAHALFMSLPDSVDDTLTLFSFGVGATATYN